MSRRPLNDEQSRMQRLQAWWLELPLSYRVNTLLYLLGALALVVLLSTLLTGNDKPRQIQVGAGVSPTTSTTFRGLGVTTTRVAGASTSTTTPGGTTTTLNAAASALGGAGLTSGGGGGAGLTSGGGGGGGGAAASGGGGGGGGTSGGGNTSGGGSTGGGGGDGAGSSGGGGGGGGGTPPTTTTTLPPCRNSTDARCGFFYWDPAPSNQFAELGDFMLTPSSPTVGQPVTITITVNEPDHGLSNACGTMTFGDNTSQGNCPPPPCPSNRFGPWTPPARPAGGTRTFSFQHTYSTPGSMRVVFQFDSRDDCHDPYGTAPGSSIKQGQIMVAPAGTTGT
jgi:hypothetical protein